MARSGSPRLAAATPLPLTYSDIQHPEANLLGLEGPICIHRSYVVVGVVGVVSGEKTGGGGLRERARERYCSTSVQRPAGVWARYPVCVCVCVTLHAIFDTCDDPTLMLNPFVLT